MSRVFEPGWCIIVIILSTGPSGSHQNFNLVHQRMYYVAVVVAFATKATVRAHAVAVLHAVNSSTSRSKVIVNVMRWVDNVQSYTGSECKYTPMSLHLNVSRSNVSSRSELSICWLQRDLAASALAGCYQITSSPSDISSTPSAFAFVRAHSRFESANADSDCRISL